MPRTSKTAPEKKCPRPCLQLAVVEGLHQVIVSPEIKGTDPIVNL